MKKDKRKKRVQLKPAPEPLIDMADGIIRAEGMELDGRPVKLVERLPNERVMLDLIEYQNGNSVVGNRVIVGTAEYQPY